MTSIASVNSAALLILQQTGPAANSTQSVGPETDILKIANGVSSEPSQGTKSAAAAIGKFAVDSAPPATGSIVVGGLGAADSWEELQQLVKDDDTLSDSEKKAWLSQLVDMQNTMESFTSSDFYADLQSGALMERVNATRPQSPAQTPESRERTSQILDSMNKFLVEHGRDPLHASTYSSLMEKGL